MRKTIFETNRLLGDYCAGQISDLLRANPTALICLAAGGSSLPVFDALLERVRKGGISFENASFVSMDEWVGMNELDEYGCGGFLRRHFLGEAGFASVCLCDGRADDLAAECNRVEAYVAGRGGIDYLLFGIGMNGHVALNEPGVDPELGVHVALLDPLTAQVGQKYFPDGARLTGGVTIGIATARAAKKTVLVVNSANKREIAARFLAEPPHSGLPATYLKGLDGFEALFTADAHPEP